MADGSLYVVRQPKSKSDSRLRSDPKCWHNWGPVYSKFLIEMSKGVWQWKQGCEGMGSKSPQSKVEEILDQIVADC